MGKESALKSLRKQLRTVVRETLPEVLKEELVLSASRETRTIMEGRLSAIAKQVDSALDEMNTRSKELQSFVLRNSIAPSPAGLPQASQAPVEAPKT